MCRAADLMLICTIDMWNNYRTRENAVTIAPSVRLQQAARVWTYSRRRERVDYTYTQIRVKFRYSRGETIADSAR